MKFLKWLGLFLLLGSLFLPAQEQPKKETKTVIAQDQLPPPPPVDPAKEKDILHLLDLTGASNLIVHGMDSMEANIKPLMTNALPPGDYRARLVELFFQRFHDKRDPKAMIALVVPIYDKYYTAEEIKGLIQFYESPLGRKMASVLPKVMEESQKAGGDWGRKLGAECMKEVLAENPDLAKQLEAATKAQQGTAPPQ